MKNERTFTFDFDTTKANAMRVALDEWAVFTPQTKKEVMVKELKSGKRSKTTTPAF